MIGRVICLTLGCLLGACIDNPTTNLPGASDSGDVQIDAADVGFDTESDMRSCYIPNDGTGTECESPFVSIGTPSGDFCTTSCDAQVQCGAGCICFQNACVDADDLRR